MWSVFVACCLYAFYWRCLIDVEFDWRVLVLFNVCVFEIVLLDLFKKCLACFCYIWYICALYNFVLYIVVLFGL